ncbi:unnamed protein product, partial [Prorocentrum cordatum]
DSVEADELAGLLEALRPSALAWHGGLASRVRAAGLLLTLVAGSSRACRSAFVAEGLPLLLEVLGEAAAALCGGGLAEPGEAAFWAQGCMLCLSALPTEEAPSPEQVLYIHRQLCWLDRWSIAQAASLGDGEQQPGAVAAAAVRADIAALLRRWGGGPLPGDPVRGKVAELFVHGLMCPAEPLPAGDRGGARACEEEVLEQRSSIIGAAVDLEVALHRTYGGTTKGYSKHARMLRSNLCHPSNGPLRRRIVAGAVSAEEVVSMDSDALAPTFLQEERRAAEQKVLREVTVAPAAPSPPSGSPAGGAGSPAASKSPGLPGQPDPGDELRRAVANSLPGAAGGA